MEVVGKMLTQAGPITETGSFHTTPQDKQQLCEEQSTIVHSDALFVDD